MKGTRGHESSAFKGRNYNDKLIILGITQFVFIQKSDLQTWNLHEKESCADEEN